MQRYLASCIAVVIAAVGCKPRAASTSETTTVRNETPAPKGRCDVDAQIIAGARQLRISEISDGHHGYWSLHVDLLGHGGGDFEGAAVASFRESREPYKTTSRPVTWPRAEVEAFVRELAAAVSKPDDGKERRRVVDSSQSIYLAFDIVGGGGGAQFVVDNAESEPLDWRLRGCDLNATPDDVRRALTTRWRALRARFGADEMFTKLSGAAPWPPRP